MSTRLEGVGASPGSTVAPPWWYEPREVAAAQTVGLEEACRIAASELLGLAEGLRSGGHAEEAGILDAQALMALDEALLAEARSVVATGGSVPQAILSAGETVAERFAASANRRLAGRAADVRDVARRIARVAQGVAVARPERSSVAVAVDLPPSVLVELGPELISGVALEAGSRTAHLAILARAMAIPAVVGVTGLLERTRDASLVAIDGESGEVLVDPDPEQRRRIDAAAADGSRQPAATHAARPLATADGHRLRLGANIGRPEEASRAVAAGAEGIGLFRTEIMFLARGAVPGEDEQADAYAGVLAALGDRPVVIRLADLGGDKALTGAETLRDAGPMAFARIDERLLLAQLRAILRAASRSRTPPSIMAPMVADPRDATRLRALVDRAGQEVGSRPPVRIGVMVEIPSAVTMAAELARRVDFLSIGTNDLAQHLLAVDRRDPASPPPEAIHPALVRSIAAVVEAGRGAGVAVAVCGELAGDPVGAVVLTGLGVDELSMESSSFGAVKRAIGAVTFARAREVATAAATAEDPEQLRASISRLLRAEVVRG